MDNLPSVSAFEIKKKLNNSQDRFYGKMSIPGVSSNESIVSKINKIFSSKDFVYKSRCRVYFESDVKECADMRRKCITIPKFTNWKLKDMFSDYTTINFSKYKQ